MISMQNRVGLHSWTLDTTPLADLLRIARETGYDAVELRYIDFKRCLDAGLSEPQVIDMIRASGVKVSVIGLESGTIFARGDERARLFASLALMCERAAAVGCDMIMVAPGRNPEGTLDEAVQNFAAGADVAAKYGLRYALEFNSRHPVVNRLAVAREILARAQRVNAGLLIDAYHSQCAGDGGRAFEGVPARDIFAFQFSDVPPGPISQVRTPLDRLPPGTGVVRWPEVFELLIEKEFPGYVNYEAPNPAQWSRDPMEVAREGLATARAMIAAAEQAVAARRQQK